jgi:cytosine/adenosine deaminase-related metal-dependent hydrolase
MAGYTLTNGIIVTAGQTPAPGALSVADGVFTEDACHHGQATAVDLKGGSVIYPALINTHDHLRGNYRPQVGPPEGTYYLNWLPWDNDLKASACYAERTKALPIEDGYLLSAYKCLFSGVVTVNDHFPHRLNRDILPTLPIHAILEFGLAHEATSYDLKWGEGLETEYKRAVKNKWPFITHLAEGFDEESMRSVESLEKQGMLDSHCLLIHCIGLSDDDIARVVKAGASISWCSASNMLMFNTTAKIRNLLKAGVNVTIGTDSSASGSYNFLAEIKYARDLYQKMYGEDIGAKTLFKMITANAAKAFWLDKKIGTLEAGKLADILVLKGRKDDPFENLVSASMEDIELLTLEGMPLYGEKRFLELIGGKLPEGYTEITVGDRAMFVKGDPAALYRTVRQKVGFKKELSYLPFEPGPEK